MSGELKRWNLHQIDTQNILTSSLDASAKCVISPNGRWIATPSGRQGLILTLWDALTGAEVLSFQGHTKTINSCAISPDNSWIVTASDYSHQPLFDCAFHPDGQHFIVAAEDGLYFFLFSSTP